MNKTASVELGKVKGLPVFMIKSKSTGYLPTKELAVVGEQAGQAQ